MDTTSTNTAKAPAARRKPVNHELEQEMAALRAENERLREEVARKATATARVPAAPKDKATVFTESVVVALLTEQRKCDRVLIDLDVEATRRAQVVKGMLGLTIDEIFAQFGKDCADMAFCTKTADARIRAIATKAAKKAAAKDPATRADAKDEAAASAAAAEPEPEAAPAKPKVKRAPRKSKAAKAAEATEAPQPALTSEGLTDVLDTLANTDDFEIPATPTDEGNVAMDL